MCGLVAADSANSWSDPLVDYGASWATGPQESLGAGSKYLQIRQSLQERRMGAGIPQKTSNFRKRAV
jgi:hypothetical protein